MFTASTDLMSGEHTSRFLVPFLRWLNPDISPAALAQVNFLVRKAAHVTEYAILAALLFRGWGSLVRFLGWRSLAALATAGVFAAGDEFHQSFVSSRTASLGDVLLDCAGACCGVLLYRLCLSVKGKKPHDSQFTGT